MGHDDEIVLSDAHFLVKLFKSNVLRLNGVNIPELLLGVLPLFELDSYDLVPLTMMAAVDGSSISGTNITCYYRLISCIIGGNNNWVC